MRYSAVALKSELRAFLSRGGMKTEKNLECAQKDGLKVILKFERVDFFNSITVQYWYRYCCTTTRHHDVIARNWRSEIGS